jgi:HK97 family phage prohead protease
MTLKPKANDLEIRSSRIEDVRVSTSDDGSHSVSGYAIVFNSPSVDLGGFTEIVAPTSLTRTLVDNPDILCLRDHKPELLLGRTKAGSLTLSVDEKGLRFTCSLPATSTGNDLAANLQRGDIDSCSFGMSVRDDKWVSDEKGNVIRTLLDIDLFEISVVSFPAYEATSASIRTAPLEIRTLLESRDDNKACLCPCPECVAGDCDDCSNPDCDYEFCSCDPDERSRLLHLKRSQLNLRLLELNNPVL